MKMFGVMLLLFGVSTLALAQSGGGAGKVPEINAGSAGTAIAFLSGTLLVIRSKQRK